MQLHIKGLEVIYPIPWLGPSKQFVGGLPSVLVSREVVSDGRLAEQLKAVLADCARQVSETKKPLSLRWICSVTLTGCLRPTTTLPLTLPTCRSRGG